MSYDWTTLTERAASAALPSFDEVRRELDPAYVLFCRGHNPSGSEGGRQQYLCPFHNDSTPSFATWIDSEGVFRAGCWSCEKRFGDVIDLVGWFGESPPLQAAVQYLNQQRADGFVQPTYERPEPVDIESILSTADAKWPLELYCTAKETMYGAEFLWSTWGVRGLDNGEILIPHYDESGQLCGLKHRNATTKPMSYRGSSFTSLYGTKSDRVDGSDVVLCEGESDTWLASFLFPERFVLGLPSGGNQRPDTFDLGVFAGRDVYLAFDNDPVGNAATQSWAVALAGNAANIYSVPLPEGEDLSSTRDPRLCFANARTMRGYAGAVEVVGSSMVRRTSKGDTLLSNFAAVPTRELRGDGEVAYEVTISPTGTESVITTADCASVTTFTKWANRHNATWYGTQRDTQEFLALLQSQAFGLGHGRFSTVAGLHDHAFVLPNTTIGDGYWRYVPPIADVGLANMIHLGEEGGYEILDALLHLHRPEVIDPILAWLAVAPLRSQVREFPILAITGASGTGKTTLTECVLRSMTGTLITTNLTATTPYAVDSFVGSTNALPVWFDEYRPGARRDTIERLEQVLRDAYTAQPSFKGGLSSNLSQLTMVQTTAPIVVSGEDMFSETSHLERMIMVSLPKEGKNAEALYTLSSSVRSLAKPYLTWLVSDTDRLDRGTSFNAWDGLGPRVSSNLNRLLSGWRLLTQFAEEVFDKPLREPDLSRVTSTIREATATDPILEMLQWSYDRAHADSIPTVWLSDGEALDACLYVSVRNVLENARRNGTFQLPGGAQAVKNYLQEQLGGEEKRVRHPIHGHVRVMAIPNGAVHLALKDDMVE